MGKNEDVLAAIFLGIVGLAGVFTIITKNCKFCNSIIPRGYNKCTKCGRSIWKMFSSMGLPIHLSLKTQSIIGITVLLFLGLNSYSNDGLLVKEIVQFLSIYSIYSMITLLIAFQKITNRTKTEIKKCHHCSGILLIESYKCVNCKKIQ